MDTVLGGALFYSGRWAILVGRPGTHTSETLYSQHGSALADEYFWNCKLVSTFLCYNFRTSRSTCSLQDWTSGVKQGEAPKNLPDLDSVSRTPLPPILQLKT